MLILQRRKGQALSINHNITLTVVDAGTDWVKLAIDAPKEIPILRTELKEAAAKPESFCNCLPSSFGGDSKEKVKNRTWKKNKVFSSKSCL